MYDSSSEKLRELLNNKFTPQKEITEKNVGFGTPSIDEGEGYNTTMTLTGKPGKGYYNSVEVKYRRVDLSALSDEIEIRKEGQLTLEEICTYLNNGYTAFLSVDDLEPIDIPVLPVGGSDYITLVAKSDSVGWTGSQSVAIHYGKPPLNVALGRTRLSTLTPPGEHADFPTAWALLYYQDFTCIRDSLKINNQTGGYTDRLVVQALVSKLGIPIWVENSPRDLPTSGVPGSNPAFDRVVVQEYVGSNEMYGPLYMHYNTTKFDGA